MITLLRFTNRKFVPLNRLKHTSWVAVVTPTDRPKLVHNRCVIEDVYHFAFWPDCKAIPAYGLMMSVCPSVRLSTFG